MVRLGRAATREVEWRPGSEWVVTNVSTHFFYGTIACTSGVSLMP